MDPFSTVIPVLSLAVLTLGLTALAVTGWAYSAVLRALAANTTDSSRSDAVSRPSSPPRLGTAGRELPPVSILKPLKGADADLLENLSALARQEYPEFELVFGVADAADPAVAVVARLAERFPEVQIHLAVGEAPFGLNPKVRNLASICRHVRHRLVLISDADVRPDPGYLRAMVLRRRPTAPGERPAGLVSSLLAAAPADSPSTLGALCERLHWGTFVAAGISATAAAGQPCVVGKSMLFHLDDLEELGGWFGVSSVLAEDYVLGQAFHAAGHRVALSSHVLPVVAGRRGVRTFAARHLRWAQMRCRIHRGAYLGEALLNPVPALLTAAGLALVSGPAWISPVALAGVAVKVLADALLLHRLGSLERPRSVRDAAALVLSLAAIPLKDLLITAVWCAAPFRATVAWRGTRLRLGRGSRLTPLDRPRGETFSVEEATA